MPNVDTCYGEEYRQRVLAVSGGQGGNLRADKESFPEKGTFKHQHPENGSRNNERMNAK